MAELEAIRERHHPGVSPVGGRYDVCDYCGGIWPCDTAVALAEVERLRGWWRRRGGCAGAEVGEVQG